MSQPFFSNTHLGISLNFTDVCLMGGIPPPSRGIVEKNRSTRIILYLFYKQLFTLPGILHSYECATKSLLFWTINTPYFNGIWSTVIESSLLSVQRSTTKPPRLDHISKVRFNRLFSLELFEARGPTSK